MTLNKNFPIDPYEIIDPNVRWYPGSEIGDESRDKLLAPLVNKIRKGVRDWREQGYPNISDVTQSLLNYWFKTEHPNGFQYYFAQRESVESIIYLYEHELIRNNSELLKYDSTALMVDSMFDETWLRLVIKQATGTGKTKVLSLLIAWCYFHKEFNENSELSQNFLLLAPNTIVLDRLKVDIEGLRVFNEDPVLPPNSYAGRSWNFYPKVHIQDNIGTLSKSGNIFLTNIQRFVTRREKVDENQMKYFLGNEPVTKTTNNKILVRDVVNNIEDIVVFNDEAHHIHEKKLAWFKTIESVNNSLVQKSSKLSLQLDVSATPKDQKGNIFPHTISDYPLIEAIAQQVVKTPILPDEASRGKLKENISTKFSERWREFIDLGVTVWEQDYEKHKKLDKKALLFIMVDDTQNSDDVKEYLENTYPLLKGGTFVIHTNREGMIDEGTSGKSKKDLEELRKLSNQVDSEHNNIKAIVSVLMLKEGWDVKNVTTVVGLRPFVATSNILPEQALGRGLRRMYFGQDVTEELNVVGTPAFMDFVESIKSEGILFEKRPMHRGSEPAGPTIIEIDKEKNRDKLDIEIPVLSPTIIREYKNLEELDVENFDFKTVELIEFTPEEQKNIIFREIIDDKVVKEVQMRDDLHINATSIITFFTNSIIRELRLYGGQDILYGKLKEFMSDRLFGKTVNLEDSNVARNLSESNVRFVIRETFKKHINALTVLDKGTSEIQNYIKVSNQKTFSIPRVKKFLPAKKSIFNKIVGDSDFELQFAGFLDAAVDVNRFIKNYIQLGFRMEYINHEGGISYYYPDFVVHLNNGERFVVETKGAENLDDPRKIDRLKNWCEDATKATGKTYRHLYVRQEDWNSLDLTPNSFNEIITVFG